MPSSSSSSSWIENALRSGKNSNLAPPERRGRVLMRFGRPVAGAHVDRFFCFRFSFFEARWPYMFRAYLPNREWIGFDVGRSNEIEMSVGFVIVGRRVRFIGVFGLMRVWML